MGPEIIYAGICVVLLVLLITITNMHYKIKRIERSEKMVRDSRTNKDAGVTLWDYDPLTGQTVKSNPKPKKK